MTKDFLKAGHTPTLFAAFLYFDISFMVWVVLGPLGVQIAQDLGLTPAQKGLMVATPILAGALLRVVLGLLVDHLGPKRAGMIGQVDRAWPGLLWPGWSGSHSFPADPGAGRDPRRGRRVLRGGPAAGLALVSAGAPGHGAGHRRCRQLRHGARRAVRARPGRARSAGSLCSAWPSSRLPSPSSSIVLLAKDAPDCPPPKSLAEYLQVLQDRRRLVVHVLLLRHLRRLRRPGLVADDLLQRPSTA